MMNRVILQVIETDLPPYCVTTYTMSSNIAENIIGCDEKRLLINLA